MRSTILAGLIAIPSATMLGQNPGQNVRIKVVVASIARTADTTGVSYVVTSLATSTEPLWLFFVDAPGGVVRMTQSTGSLRWSTETSTHKGPMASWMFRHDYVAPGATTPQLHFESTGLPGILSYWAGGHFELPEGGDEMETDTIPDSFVTEMITGKTVGVEPWPADRSSKALIARLRTLTQRSCAAQLRWITSSSLCIKLISYLDQAETNRAGGNATKAKSSMATYIKSLSGKSARTFAVGVKNQGYWLLKPNADIIVSKL